VAVGASTAGAAGTAGATSDASAVASAPPSAARRQRRGGFWPEEIRLGERSPFPTIEEYYQQQRDKRDAPEGEPPPAEPEVKSQIILPVAPPPSEMPAERLEAMLDAMAPVAAAPEAPAEPKPAKAVKVKAAKAVDDEDAILWLLLAA
jgi:hypothetical protein